MGDHTYHHRKYCNYVKRDLLSKCKSQPNTFLLDLCSGRGGDMFKWKDLGIGVVVGLDSDPKSTKEAIRRYLVNKTKLYGTKIRFHTVDVTNKEMVRKILAKNGSRRPSIVSCMFALHYFCASQESLDLFLSIVSQNLQPGGLFVGVCPDKEYIVRMLEGSLEVPNVSASSVGVGKYVFSISDPSCTDYFSFRGGSLEYLVDRDLLVGVAKSNNLHLVEIGNIYHDYPDHPNKQSPISQLYVSFMFRKSPETPRDQGSR